MAPRKKTVDSTRQRFESFTDGVMAIAITLLALKLKVPLFTELSSEMMNEYLLGFGAFVLSFVTIAIFWVNHHRLSQHIHPDGLSRRALWANILFLMFVTLIPFASASMSENFYHNTSVIIFGLILLGASLSFALVRTFIHHEPITMIEAQRSFVGPIVYALAIVALYVAPPLGYAFLAIPPLYYFLPTTN